MIGATAEGIEVRKSTIKLHAVLHVQYDHIVVRVNNMQQTRGIQQ